VTNDHNIKISEASISLFRLRMSNLSLLDRILKK